MGNFKNIIYFLLIFASSCKSVYQISKVEYASAKLDTSYASNQVVSDIIAPYKNSLDLTMNELVANTAKELAKAKPESALGNLLADATLIEAEKYFTEKPDLAIVNYGGIRIPSLPKGKISLGKMFELMPFDNYINIVYVKGDVLQEVCNLMAAKGGWPVSGLSYQIKDQKAKNISVNEMPIALNKIYKVALSDYLANGGDNLSMLKDKEKLKSNLLLRDAFINYFKQFENQNQLIDSKIEGRVIHVE